MQNYAKKINSVTRQTVQNINNPFRKERGPDGTGTLAFKQLVSAVRDERGQTLPRVSLTEAVVHKFCRNWSNVRLFQFLLRKFFISILAKKSITLPQAF